MAEYAEREFAAYLNLLEQGTIAQDITLSSLEGLEIFSIGVGLAHTGFIVGTHATPPRNARQGVSMPMRNALSLLTTLRERFRSVRGLHSVFDRFVHAILFANGSDTHWTELEPHVLASEILVPERVRSMMRSTLELSCVTNADS